MDSQVSLHEKLPIGAIDNHATGWWTMIFVILTEAALFAYLLFTYYYLAAQPHPLGSFPQGGAPSMRLALSDTIILLISSATVAWGQSAIEKGNQKRLVLGIGITAILGMIFLVVQYFEWKEKHFGLAWSSYSSLYFTITGFHMAHVLIGVMMLWALLFWAVRGNFDRRHTEPIHVGALYWHFVDAVWLVVFFTFYITPLLGLRT